MFAMLISINPKVLSINPKRKVSSEKVMFKSAWTRCETNIKVSSTFLKLKMNSKHNQTSVCIWASGFCTLLNILFLLENIDNCTSTLG